MPSVTGWWAETLSSVASGSRTTAAIITGSGVVARRGSGSLIVTAVNTGSSTGMLSGTGFRIVTTVITGAGVVKRVGSGFRITTAAITGTGNVGTADFVTRNPVTGHLMLNGQRFRFGGNNGEMAGLTESTTTYGETVTGGLHTMNHSAIDAYFVAVQGMEAGVIRAFLVSMGTPDSLMPTMNVYNDTAFDGYDYALSKCRTAGIKVIFALVDNYDYFHGGKFDWCTLSGVTPDSDASQFFSNSTVIANFRAYVSHLLNHVNVYTGIIYKNDPSILAWETGNEMQSTGQLSTQPLLDWTSGLADHIKNTVGAQQLVMDGKWGILGPGNTVPATHMNDQYIDIYTEHSYDQWRTPAHMANQAAICHNFGKAFLWGEYPLTGASGWTNADAITGVEGNANVDGDLFWFLQAQGNSHGGGFTTHYPGDDATMISRVTAQKNHAIAMAGTTLSTATTPAKTATLVGPDVTAGLWTARSAANVSGGQINLPSGDTAYSTATKWDLSNSSVAVELVTKNPGTGSAECGLYVQNAQAPYSGDLFGIIITGNTVKYRHRVGAINSDTTETYNSSSHRWLRLRASADATVLTAFPYSLGTIYWDVSSDGVTWVNKRSLTPGLVLTSVNVVLSNLAAGDGTSGTAVFDNVNKTLTGMAAAATITGGGVVKKVGSGSITAVATATGSASAAPTFLIFDNFTDTNGVPVTSHISDTGHTWIGAPGGYEFVGTIQANHAMATGNSAWYSSAVPVSADYEIAAQLTVKTAIHATAWGVNGRMSTGADTRYFAFLYAFSGSFTLYLARYLNSGYVELANVALPSQPVAGSSHSIKLRMFGNQISVYYDGVLRIGPVTNSEIIVAGRPGFSSALATTTTGVHFDSISATAL